ncbi:hypothetical protein GWK47_044309 [Chionoecetes opilio]|uniref:Uncharacterized protein n=1 Tax=Chionoecetes opilio TaxID=41210 RepID=A0A8J5CVR4_CHIOP|nr:hypothetical protein GWK47_044309 [Chionoecetes opilio]
MGASLASHSLHREATYHTVSLHNQEQGRAAAENDASTEYFNHCDALRTYSREKEEKYMTPDTPPQGIYKQSGRERRLRRKRRREPDVYSDVEEVEIVRSYKWKRWLPKNFKVDGIEKIWEYNGAVPVASEIRGAYLPRLITPRALPGGRPSLFPPEAPSLHSCPGVNPLSPAPVMHCQSYRYITICCVAFRKTCM